MIKMQLHICKCEMEVFFSNFGIRRIVGKFGGQNITINQKNRLVGLNLAISHMSVI